MKPTPSEGQTDLLGVQACGTVAGALVAGEPLEAAIRLGRASMSDDVSTLDVEAAEPAALLVPLEDDSAPLGLRVDRMAAWTRGFLSGLGQAGERLLALGDEAQDVLRNLESISHGAEIAGDARAPAGGEEAEALRELIDYLRFAVEFFRSRLA